MKKLTFDIMVGDRFYKTMRMPITLDMVADYQGDQPIIDGEKNKSMGTTKMPNT